jgi:hypothetical protein
MLVKWQILIYKFCFRYIEEQDFHTNFYLDLYLVAINSYWIKLSEVSYKDE